ncbi:hypothetical protein BHE74_00031989 [Ensete ventricosum]|nr:hypothetical protein BHE74_00031989 [Ensete ventricosum]
MTLILNDENPKTEKRKKKTSIDLGTDAPESPGDAITGAGERATKGKRPRGIATSAPLAGCNSESKYYLEGFIGTLHVSNQGAWSPSFGSIDL